MRHLLKYVFGAGLCLMLLVTGQSMAAQRGAAAATGQMVICIGLETVTVYVDDEGNPTTAPHICPECIVHFVQGPVPFSAACFDAETQEVFLASPALLRGHRTVGKGYFSRAPPYRA
jgi:hypothetical protein